VTGTVGLRDLGGERGLVVLASAELLEGQRHGLDINLSGII
jgi:hypothetical protein